MEHCSESPTEWEWFWSLSWHHLMWRVSGKINQNMVEKIKPFVSPSSMLAKHTSIRLIKFTVHYLRASIKPEQHNGISVIKTWSHKNMRAHILMFDLHSCWFDKISLINEYEWVVKLDPLITVSVSQLPCLSCARLCISTREKLRMSLSRVW